MVQFHICLYVHGEMLALPVPKHWVLYLQVQGQKALIEGAPGQSSCRFKSYCTYRLNDGTGSHAGFRHLCREAFGFDSQFKHTVLYKHCGGKWQTLSLQGVVGSNQTLSYGRPMQVSNPAGVLQAVLRGDSSMVEQWSCKPLIRVRFPIIPEQGLWRNGDAFTI